MSISDSAEQLNGAALAEEQVNRIRDAALVVVTPSDVAAAVAEQRGYIDMDPANLGELAGHPAGVMIAR